MPSKTILRRNLGNHRTNPRIKLKTKVISTSLNQTG
jgi:hypothetical protein